MSKRSAVSSARKKIFRNTSTFLSADLAMLFVVFNDGIVLLYSYPRFLAYLDIRQRP